MNECQVYRARHDICAAEVTASEVSVPKTIKRVTVCSPPSPSFSSWPGPGQAAPVSARPEEMPLLPPTAALGLCF